MHLNTTKERLHTDPVASSLVDLISNNQTALGLKDSQVYFQFPLYKDNETVVVSKLLVVSRRHGVLLFGTANITKADAAQKITAADSELDVVFGHLHARLTKQKSLRRDKKTLAFNLEAAIFAPILNGQVEDLFVDSVIISTLAQLSHWLEEIEIPDLDDSIFLEICSVVEGAKGLLAPRPRELVGKAEDSKVAQVSALEAEIRNFDQEQKQGYMTVLDGPQRIRGLAGSGKTIILAMKAALTHLQFPEANIVYTFYTKSLYQYVRRLITRFYRQYDDQDPDWDKLQVLHAWGGRSQAGLYSNACVAHGVTPLTYGDVSGSRHPFDTVCLDLLQRTKIVPQYDYVFVDEGQDFPTSFLQLCLKLARDNRFVYAYDELQTIFQAEIPSAESVFGTDFDLSEDVVLHKCYRNPLEILVCAHSLGFGIYSEKIVQLLENKDHWVDVGYEVVSGEFKEGQTVDILRPERNSPSSISKRNSIDQIIQCSSFKTAFDEIANVAESIARDIHQEGLNPEDIVAICADDRYAKSYFKTLAEQLAERKIATNNMSADSFSGDVFTREGCVTLTSIHRAKGNEGYSVYVLGIDALFHRPSVRTRNMIFTAMTRAKAWLQITGVGDAAEAFSRELAVAKSNCPHIIFKYPSEADLKVMKRDLSEDSAQKIDRALEELSDELAPDELRRLLEERLARLGGERKKAFGLKKRNAKRDL